MTVGSSETGPSRSDIEVLVFAKRPDPGRVKTRLATDIGPEVASELAAAFLGDTLERVTRWAAATEGVSVAVVGTPDDPAGFAAYLQPSVGFRPQAEGHLGRRMEVAVLEARELERGAVLLGADTPDLPLEILDAAIRTIRGGAISLTPSTDGGFAQIGIPLASSPGAFASVFEPSEWGTPAVLERTREALRRSGGSSEETLPFRDIDELADLVQWWQKEAPLPETPRTAAVIRARLGSRPEFRRTGP